MKSASFLQAKIRARNAAGKNGRVGEGNCSTGGQACRSPALCQGSGAFCQDGEIFWRKSALKTRLWKKNGWSWKCCGKKSKGRSALRWIHSGFRAFSRAGGSRFLEDMLWHPDISSCQVHPYRAATWLLPDVHGLLFLRKRIMVLTTLLSRPEPFNSA